MVVFRCSLTDFSDVHEHGNKDVVKKTKGGAIGEQGIPHLQDAGERELTSIQEANPPTGRRERKVNLQAKCTCMYAELQQESMHVHFKHTVLVEPLHH